MNNQQLINYLHGRGLVGGAGSKEGAKNNAYTQFNIRNKQKGYTRDELKTAYYNNPMANLPIKDNDELNRILGLETYRPLEVQPQPQQDELSRLLGYDASIAPMQIQPQQDELSRLLGYDVSNAPMKIQEAIQQIKNTPVRKQRTKKIRTKKAPNVAEIRALAKASGIKLSHMVAGKRRLYTKGELMAFLNLI